MPCYSIEHCLHCNPVVHHLNESIIGEYIHTHTRAHTRSSFGACADDTLNMDNITTGDNAAMVDDVSAIVTRLFAYSPCVQPQRQQHRQAVMNYNFTNVSLVCTHARPPTGPSLIIDCSVRVIELNRRCSVDMPPCRRRFVSACVRARVALCRTATAAHMTTVWYRGDGNQSTHCVVVDSPLQVATDEPLSSSQLYSSLHTSWREEQQEVTSRARRQLFAPSHIENDDESVDAGRSTRLAQLVRKQNEHRLLLRQQVRPSPMPFRQDVAASVHKNVRRTQKPRSPMSPGFRF